MTISRVPDLAGYQLRLEGFEGPLDVLLRMIEQREMEVSELSLVAVTDGFLQHVEAIHEAPPQLLADFAGIASRLLVLKSRALLPKPERDDEPDEDVDDLATQLREYQRVRRMADRLHEVDDVGWRSFSRPVLDVDRAVNIRLVLPPANSLHRAFVRVLDRQPAEPEIAPIRRVISVVEMAQRFVGALARARRARRFAELVNVSDRHETVAGFVALMALWNRHTLHVEQQQLFGEIYVSGDPSPSSASDSEE